MRRPAIACDARVELLRLLRLRSEDLLGPGEQELLSAHLSTCPSCRDEALAADPTLLFLPLSRSGARAAHAVPEAVSGDAAGEGRRFAARVRAALDLDRTRRRFLSGRGWRILRGGRDVPGRAAVRSTGAVATRATAARVMKVAVGAAVLAGIVVVASVLRPTLPWGVPSAGPATPSATARTVSSPLSSLPTAWAGGSGNAPPIEVVASPGAKVYQFAPASRQDPTVVFVVDRDADL